MTNRHEVVCVGLATLDTILAVPRHPEPDDRVVASDAVVAGGGPAATAAVALARLGVATAFVGAVGDDAAGAAIGDGLEREGVDVSGLAVVGGARSPQSTILVGPGGERAIVHVPGTATLAVEADRLRAARWVHVDHVGYPAVRGLGLRLSVDGGNPIPELDLGEVELYAPSAGALLASGDGGRDALVAAARRARSAGARLVVVTCGPAGSFAVGGDGEPVEAPAPPVEAVSTLGAGDVFHGALLAQLLRDAPLADALAEANRVAAESCRALDGRSAIPLAVRS